MINHGNEIKIFSGNSNRPLAEAIAAKLNTTLGDMEVTHFSDGEIYVRFAETIRGMDVFLVQSTSYPVNTNLMELLIMIDAAKRASAGLGLVVLFKNTKKIKRNVLLVIALYIVAVVVGIAVNGAMDLMGVI